MNNYTAVSYINKNSNLCLLPLVSCSRHVLTFLVSSSEFQAVKRCFSGTLRLFPTCFFSSLPCSWLWPVHLLHLSLPQRLAHKGQWSPHRPRVDPPAVTYQHYDPEHIFKSVKRGAWPYLPHIILAKIKWDACKRDTKTHSTWWLLLLVGWRNELCWPVLLAVSCHTKLVRPSDSLSKI